jgi:transposase InsO family protein
LGLDVGRRRVGRLMRQNGIHVVLTRKCKAKTDSDHTFSIAPNLLDRAFHATGPSQKWAGDITYIWIHEGSFIWPSFWTFIPGVSLPCVICTQIPSGSRMGD